MVMILELPNEILCLILTFVPPQSGKRFLSSCHKLYQLKYDQLFWRDFARHLGIIYRDPQQSWWDLYATGDIFNICKHLHDARLMTSLIWKSDIFWKSLTTKCCEQQQQASGLCLYPYCQFVGKIHDTHESSSTLVFTRMMYPQVVEMPSFHLNSIQVIFVIITIRLVIHMY